MKAAKVVLDNFRTSSTVVVTVPVAWPVDVSRVVAVVPSYACQEYSDRIVVSDWGADCRVYARRSRYAHPARRVSCQLVSRLNTGVITPLARATEGYAT